MLKIRGTLAFEICMERQPPFSLGNGKISQSLETSTTLNMTERKERTEIFRPLFFMRNAKLASC